MAQSVKRLTSAQVMISQLVSSSPASGSVLTAQSLEPASESVSPSLSAPSLLVHTHMLSISFKINIKKNLIKKWAWGAWVAQSVNCLTSAQVMISWLVGLSPASGSVLTARSLEPASDSVSPPLSAPSPLAHCLTQK